MPRNAFKKRLTREFQTISVMTEMYCKAHHKPNEQKLCKNCNTFLEYARARLESCRYAEQKPPCAHCTTHCYKQLERETAKTIMRYSGPKMTLQHPLLAMLHLLDKLKKTPSRQKS